MAYGGLSLVGRDQELEELLGAIRQARSGRGGVWLLCGEPGAGKSRLAEEAARASAEEVNSLWGRCWEAGGAPAYWPWIQILRALFREDEEAAVSPARAPYLVQLLPELRDRAAEIAEPPPLDAEQARFQLLDAISATLCDAAARAPRLLVLEDLHAADSSSLLLLDFLARQTPGAPLMILGTYRDTEVGPQAPGMHLARIAQEAHTIALGRLGRKETATFLERALGAPQQRALVDAVWERTEGNPLFLVEVSRLLVSQGEGGAAGTQVARAIPRGVRAAIRERLAGLSEGAHEVLALASVFGREFRTARLADAYDRDPVEVAEPLAEAAGVALVHLVKRGEYRFSHTLIREVLYEELGDARRQELHLSAAEALEEIYGEDSAGAPWSEIAHHYLAAGEAGRARAIEACIRAGDRLFDQLAFEEAAESYLTALGALGRAPEPSPPRKAELLLAHARARMRAGELEAGRESCRGAAQIARDLEDAELLARAALEYGSVFLFAHVDQELVALLEEALAGIPEEESSLRARLLARLAAALQPAEDPREPIALAREAIVMARRIGDPHTRLEALRAGCSAMMDLEDPAVRLPLNREHAALAQELGDRTELLRGSTRLAFDCIELGDLAGASAAMEDVERLADEIGHPYFRWRAFSFRAMRALWEGRLEEAEQLITEAHALGAQGGDRNAPVASVFQRARLLYLRGDHDGLVAAAGEFRHIFRGTPLGNALASVVSGAILCRAGRVDEARARLDLNDQLISDVLIDRTSIESLAEIAAATGDTELAGNIYERLEGQADGFVSGGVIGMTWEGPFARVLALAAATLGRHDEASRCFDAALKSALAAGGRPAAALVQCEHAEHLLRRGETKDAPRVAALLEGSEQIAREVKMAGVLARIAACRDAAPEPRARPGGGVSFSLRREGEYWSVECDGETFRLKDVKGLRVLAQLVSEPGRDFHVLDLSGPGGEGAVDAGDAGELLDEEARRSYRLRVQELREEIEQAERYSDLGRAERARGELDFLSAELARAVGLGGRARKSGAAAERARVNIQRRLRDAIRRIESQHPALGRHLSRSVQTGLYCSYSPE